MAWMEAILNVTCLYYLPANNHPGNFTPQNGTFTPLKPPVHRSGHTFFPDIDHFGGYDFGKDFAYNYLILLFNIRPAGTGYTTQRYQGQYTEKYREELSVIAEEGQNVRRAL